MCKKKLEEKEFNRFSYLRHIPNYYKTIEELTLVQFFSKVRTT